MANCYICGKPNVNYKRNVHTGNSYRTTLSMRGNAYLSQSAHYGTRTVCAKCALNIDRKMNSNPHWIFILLLVLIGLSPSIFAFLPGFISNFPLKGLIPIGIGWFCVGILVFIAAKIDGKQRGERWYASNKNRYVDEVDIRQVLDKTKQDKVAFEEGEKLTEIQQSILSILELLSQEKNLLETKVKYINTNYESLNLCTVADCDKILAELKQYEADAIESKKSTLAQAESFIKQAKGFTLKSELLDYALKPVNDSMLVYSNMVAQFSAGIRTAENQILQVKMKIMEQNKIN